MKEETSIHRSLTVEAMAAMQAPVERHRKGWEEEEPGVKSQAKPLLKAMGRRSHFSRLLHGDFQAASSQPFSGPALAGGIGLM